jgi:hypothetical protein
VSTESGLIILTLRVGALIPFSFSDNEDLLGSRRPEVSDDEDEEDDDPDELREASNTECLFVTGPEGEAEGFLLFDLMSTFDLFGLGDEFDDDDEDSESESLDEEESSSGGFLLMAAGRFDFSLSSDDELSCWLFVDSLVFPGIPIDAEIEVTEGMLVDFEAFDVRRDGLGSFDSLSSLSESSKCAFSFRAACVMGFWSAGL